MRAHTSIHHPPCLQRNVAVEHPVVAVDLRAVVLPRGVCALAVPGMALGGHGAALQGHVGVGRRAGTGAGVRRRRGRGQRPESELRGRTVRVV